MDILIVGAGLGGLTAAAVLQQRGHRVRVFEQAPQLGEVGAGIQLSANAMKVLDVVGIRPALLRAGVRPQSWDFRRFDTGELLHRLPLGDEHEDAFGAPYLQLHWADLHAALQQVVLSHDTTGMMLDARAIAITEREDCVQVSVAPETHELQREQYEQTMNASRLIDFQYKGTTLEINFADGSSYENFGLPKSVYNSLINSNTPDRFARRHIYHSYVYRKVTKAMEVAG